MAKEKSKRLSLLRSQFKRTVKSARRKFSENPISETEILKEIQASRAERRTKTYESKN